jgi:sialic acid synthase SpsE
VDLAAENGADAVKFQFTDPDRLVADKSLPISYEVLIDRETGETETVTEPLYEVIKRRYLTPDQWREVKAHADDLGLAFFATTSFDEGIELLVELGCDSIKIGSVDVINLPLIRRVARTGLCVQLDTGNATIGEIESAVDTIRAEGNENVIIHHCPSGYPARLESINLNIIGTLKRMFPYPIAFSDHYPGWEMDVAAVALGANVIEKTITEDRTTRSIEHMFSLEPAELRHFVATIRSMETALGTTRRIMYPAELEKRRKFRRSPYLTAPAKAGTRLRDVAVDFRRPGTGLSPGLYEQMLDASLKADLPADHRLELKDLTW